MSNTITQNLGQSLLIPTQGQLTFARIPNTTFYIQQVTIPPIVLPVATQPTPFVALPMPGNSLEFPPLEITFLIDETMNAWFDIYNWLQGVGKPQSFDQYKSLYGQAPPNSTAVRAPYSDATLTIFTAKNNPSLQFQFVECFPSELGAVAIDFRESAEDILTCTAIFRYSYYTFSRISSTA